MLEKIDEELAELHRAVDDGDHESIREELGDVLFALVMLARRLELDPEDALEATNRKFRSRFQAVERALAERGTSPESSDLATMERLWLEAKSAETGPQTT